MNASTPAGISPSTAGTSIGSSSVRPCASVADTAIIPAQDLLGLGSEARMNRPGTLAGNWRWRLLPGQLTADLAQRLAVMAATYERV